MKADQQKKFDHNGSLFCSSGRNDLVWQDGSVRPEVLFYFPSGSDRNDDTVSHSL